MTMVCVRKDTVSPEICTMIWGQNHYQVSTRTMWIKPKAIRQGDCRNAYHRQWSVGYRVELNVILQEFEYEVATRLQSCGIELNWQQNLADTPITLSYAQYRHYISMLREIISNIMKHANAQKVTLRLVLIHNWFQSFLMMVLDLMVKLISHREWT